MSDLDIADLGPPTHGTDGGRRVELLAVTENLFQLAGEPGHEIVHVLAVGWPELEKLPFGATRPVLDNDSVARWYRLSELAEGKPPFYPDDGVAFAMRMQNREG